METQKGSSSFNMRLVRVSIDGEDEPIGREATLRLRTLQDHAALLKMNSHLMEIHIDGRLMACWDFSLLRQHLSYQTIQIFSSFAIGKHIHMTLPLPLGSGAAPENNAACLKAIRVYFSKSQDFHTAINWLFKHAQLIHLNGRPATSNAFHSSTSDVRKKPASSDDRPPMAYAAQPAAASQDRHQIGIRPQSFSGQPSIAQYNAKPLSRPQSRGGQPPAPQHLRQTESRCQSHGPPQSMPQGLGGLHRDSYFRRHFIALHEPDRSATTLPSIREFRNGNTGTGRLQMPRVVRTPGRTTSTAQMGNMLQSSHGLPKDDNSKVSYLVALDATVGRHSPHNNIRSPVGPLSHQPFQELHQPSDQYMPKGPPSQMATNRFSQANAFAVLPTQNTMAPDDIDVNFLQPHACDTDDAVQQRCAMPVEISDTIMPGTAPGQPHSDMQPPKSREIDSVPSSSPTLRQSTHDCPGVPPASLFAATGMASQHETDQDTAIDFESSFPRPPSAAKRQPLSEAQGLGSGNTQAAPENSFSECGLDRRQQHTAGQKRRLSAQTGQDHIGKKRKANQSAPMKRAGRQTVPDNGVGGHDSIPNDETQHELAAPAAVVSSWNQGSPAISVAASKDIQMVDHAIQTDPPARLQVDVLHLTAALELSRRLLHETRQWESSEDHDDRLLRLGTQFVRGLREMFGST